MYIIAYLGREFIAGNDFMSKSLASDVKVASSRGIHMTIYNFGIIIQDT